MNLQREVLQINGQTGSGKSYLAARLFEQEDRAVVAESGFSEFPAKSFRTFTAMMDYLAGLGAFTDKSVPFRVSYSPRLGEEPFMFRLALELGFCSLWLEEADRFGDPKQVRDYNEVVTRGRHYGVSLVVIATNPVRIPTEVRRQATRIISFRQFHPADVAALAEIMGPAAEEVPRLPDFVALEWNRDGSTRKVAV